MDESSAVTLPSPLDVLDESVANDNSSGISISDFRMEFKDLAELGKVNCLDVGCQQETLEPSNASENEECNADSPLLEPLLRKHLNSNDAPSNTAYTQSRAYLYGKQLHSLKQNDISISPKIYSKTLHEEDLMNTRNIQASVAPTPYHHAHYEHHHHFRQNEDLPNYLSKSASNCTNGVAHKQLNTSETSKCNNFPTIRKDCINSSSIPVCGKTLPNMSNSRCHKRKGSSVDGNHEFRIFVLIF